MTDDVRAITLYPEHAELFRLKLRTTETRSRPTKWRGRLLLHAGVRDEHSAVAQRSPRTRAALDAMPHGDPLTKGAVVASCVLTDCVPMVDSGEEGAIRTLNVDANGSLWIVEPQTDEEADDGPPEWRDVSDQLPFGDFTPGRYAWLLGDVQPTTSRCPRCWGSGYEVEPFVTAGGGWAWRACSYCIDGDHLVRGVGHCEPVSMRGKQGLWKPTW